LEKFRTFLKAGHVISWGAATFFTRHGRTYTCKPTVTFKVASDPLAERLRALGRYGGLIDPQLTTSRDFWRGAVDGDGSLGLYDFAYKPSEKYARLELVGTPRLLGEFLAFLRSHDMAGGMTVRGRKGANIHVLATGGRLVPPIVRLLYQDATVALDRKVDRAAAIIATQTPWQQEAFPKAA
jgi:hypothetical protein